MRFRRIRVRSGALNSFPVAVAEPCRGLVPITTWVYNSGRLISVVCFQHLTEFGGAPW